MKKFWEFYKYASGLVGIPVLAIILISAVVWSAQKVIFTTGCLTVGWKCSYAVGVQQAMAAIEGGEDFVIPPVRGKTK